MNADLIAQFAGKVDLDRYNEATLFRLVDSEWQPISSFDEPYHGIPQLVSHGRLGPSMYVMFGHGTRVRTVPDTPEAIDWDEPEEHVRVTVFVLVDKDEVVSGFQPHGDELIVAEDGEGPFLDEVRWCMEVM